MKHEIEYRRWTERLRRALKREGEKMPPNKGFLMAQFFADRTPEEVARTVTFNRNGG